MARNKDELPDPLTDGVIQGIVMGKEARGEIPEGTVESIYGTGEDEE